VSCCVVGYLSKIFRTDAVKIIKLASKRVSKQPTSTQLRATWYTDSLDMVVLPFTGVSRYHNCCIDGGTSPEYFGYTFVCHFTLVCSLILPLALLHCYCRSAGIVSNLSEPSVGLDVTPLPQAITYNCRLDNIALRSHVSSPTLPEKGWSYKNKSRIFSPP
jgi:hypothetical protein